MTFESRSSRERIEPVEGRIPFLDSLKEIVDGFKKSKAGKFSRRIGVLIAALGTIGTAEALAQNRERLDSLISATRETVTSLDSAVRANPDRRGRVIINGRHSDAFEKAVGGLNIHSNDFYIYIREEVPGRDGNPRNFFTVDIGKNGAPDQIVMVPGSINEADAAFVVNGFSDRDGRRLAQQAQLEEMSRQLHDRPYLHRTVFVLNPGTGKWQVVEFEDGSLTETSDQTRAQEWWATTSAQAMDALRQRNR